MKKPYQIGIDLGGTKIEVILFDPAGETLFRKRIGTPRRNQNEYEGILEALIDLIGDAGRQLPENQPYTIGIGIPGTINQKTLLVQNANTTCLIGKPFQQDIENKLNRKVVMENDANCFTLAECLGGAARDYDMVFGIIMGTGCGGGLCIEGRIHRGQHNIAGEWGHFAIDPQGAGCYCGNRGCVETKISGTGVERSFADLYDEPLEMEAIVTGYRNGEPRCKSVFEQFLEDFGRSVGGLISVLDPDAVVLGGGLSNIDELYSQGVESIRRYAFHQHVTTPILKNQLGDSAGVFGAAWLGDRNALS